MISRIAADRQQISIVTVTHYWQKLQLDRINSVLEIMPGLCVEFDSA